MTAAMGKQHFKCPTTWYICWMSPFLHKEGLSYTIDTTSVKKPQVTQVPNPFVNHKHKALPLSWLATIQVRPNPSTISG